MYAHACICMYIYMCVCVCVCTCMYMYICIKRIHKQHVRNGCSKVLTSVCTFLYILHAYVNMPVSMRVLYAAHATHLSCILIYTTLVLYSWLCSCAKERAWHKCIYGNICSPLWVVALNVIHSHKSTSIYTHIYQVTIVMDISTRSCRLQWSSCDYTYVHTYTHDRQL